METQNSLVLILVACLLAACSAAPTVSAASVADSRWHLQRIVQRAPLSAGQFISGAPALDTSSSTLAPVTIYVVDSALKLDHADFAPSGRAVSGTNTLDPDAPTADCNGHGTQVASLAAGAHSGVAKNARLVSVRALDCDGVGTCSSIVAALDWIADDHATRNSTHRAVVILPSRENGNGTARTGARRAVVGDPDQRGLGHPKSKNGNDGPHVSCPELVHSTRALWRAGIVVFAGAGDLAADSCQFHPPGNDAVITVGATARDDRLYKKGNVGACVDLFAPGVDILAASIAPDRPWTKVSGTDMAAAVAAGVGGLILGADASLSADDVREILTSSATPDAVMTADGAHRLTAAPNRMLYSPWARLFDTVQRNVRAVPSAPAPSDTPPVFASDSPVPSSRPPSPSPSMSPAPVAVITPKLRPPNATATFLFVAVAFRPRVAPAMAFSATRLARAVTAAAGLSGVDVVTRRAEDAVRDEGGSEPGTVGLRLYVPVSRRWVKEYMRRVAGLAHGNGLRRASKEEAWLGYANGSAMRAVGFADIIPAAVNGDHGHSHGYGHRDGSEGWFPKDLVVPLSCTLGVITFLIMLATAVWGVAKVKARRRERSFDPLSKLSKIDLV